MMISDQRKVSERVLVAVVCVALNVGLGKVSNILALPVTMDTVGTLLAAAILPWYAALLVGVASSLLGSVVIHPAFLFYIGTQIAIALVAVGLVQARAFNRPLTAAAAGLLIGIVSAVASAPVTAVVFGGVSVPSLTALNALFLASGQSLWQSVIKGAIIVESLDKVAAGLIVWSLLRRIGTSLDRGGD